MKSQKFISSICLYSISWADFMSFRNEIVSTLANQQRELKLLHLFLPGRTSLNINKLRLCYVKLRNENSQHSENETVKLQRVIRILTMVVAVENI